MIKSAKITKTKNDTHNGQVQSLTRGLLLLEKIAENKVGVSLTDLALQVGLPNSTVHRLLLTMEQRGFVVQKGDLDLWCIGGQAFLVGSSFFRSRDLISIAYPIMQKLMMTSGETVNLSVLDTSSWKTILVGQVQCEKLMRMVATIGGNLPLHASGAGKVFLSSFSDCEVLEIIKQVGLACFTEYTTDTYDKLVIELQSIRQQGYASDLDEHVLGLRCVAAPIYDENKQIIAAVSISGPNTRVKDEQIVHFGSLAIKAANTITQLYSGYSS